MAGARVVGRQPEKQTDNQREAASQSGRSRQAGRHHNRSEQVERQAGAKEAERERSVGEERRGEAAGQRGTWARGRRKQTSRSTRTPHSKARRLWGQGRVPAAPGTWRRVGVGAGRTGRGHRGREAAAHTMCRGGPHPRGDTPP